MSTEHHYLILRFSSAGDLAHCLTVADLIHQQDPTSQISWLVREDLADVVNLSPFVNQTITLPRQAGWRGLLSIALQQSRVPYTHVYDAHNNLRSRIFTLFFFASKALRLERTPQFIRRSKQRWRRFLFFQLGFPTLQLPHHCMLSYLTPLNRWFDSVELPNPPQQTSTTEKAIVLVPSSAWPLKRWPAEYFSSLIQLLPEHQFVLLGGPRDNFLEQIRRSAPERVQNLAGRLSWRETAQLIANSPLTIGNDTGALHIADWYGKPAIVCIGPVAFGHPSRSSTRVMERPLPCRPCTKDGNTKCRNPRQHQCMVDIQPSQVAAEARRLLSL